MAGQQQQLVTAGEDIRVWDTQDFACLHQYRSSGPGPTSYGSSSWSGDTACAASLVRGRDRVVLSYCKQNKFTSQEFQLQGATQTAVVQFPRTSLTSLLLGVGTQVQSYDLQGQKVSKSWKLREGVSSLAMDSKDTHLAAGGEAGAVQLVSLATGVVGSPLLADKCAGHRLTSVRYSTVKQALLGSSCQSGVIAFWDCNTSKALFSLAPHCAPATALIFSPINENLALSVGLDKKLVCCDIKAGKQVMAISCEAPLTAADFDPTGQLMAVGTSRGRVAVYDLRSPRSPLAAVSAHGSSVASLVYRPRPASAAGKGSRTKLASQRSVPSLRTVLEEAGGKENGDPNRLLQPTPPGIEASKTLFSPACDPHSVGGASVAGRRESLSSQLFSPLREAMSSVDSPAPAPPPSSATARRVSRSSDVFSPLRDSPASSVGSENLSRLSRQFGNGSFSTPVESDVAAQEPRQVSPSKPHLLQFVSPSKEHQQPASPKPTVTAAPRLKLSLDRLDSYVAEDSEPVEAEELMDQEESEEEESKEIKEEKKSATGATETTSTQFSSVLTAFPEIGQELRGGASIVADSFKVPAEKISARLRESGGGTEFQREFISGVVSEAMEDWCGGVERRLWELHFSLIRQMQHHQDETRALLEEFSRIDEMQTEMEQLRAENRELRKFFGGSGDSLGSEEQSREH